MTSRANGEKEEKSQLLGLKRGIFFILGIPCGLELREKRQMFFLFRHLIILAFAVPVLMWMFGGMLWGLANLRLILASALYCCAVLLYACRGVRFTTYAGLQALGFACVAALSLGNTWATLNTAGRGSTATVLLIGYTAAMLGFIVIGAKRWRKGPPGFLARLVDWQEGEYDLGKLMTFYGDAKRGPIERSALMDSKDRARLSRLGWVVYLLLFLSPIATAIVAGLKVNRDFLPFASYILAILTGFGASSQWMMCSYFWKWERDHNRRALVKQFTHRCTRRN